MRRSSVLLIAFAFATTWAVTSLARNQNPGIAPIHAHPHGQTYGEWAAEWWQWALETPAANNPVLDETGENCDVGQTGRVWFLAGSFFGEPVVRECTVPAGTALFLPLINQVFGAFLTDPPEERTEEFLRAGVQCGVAVVSVLIDGEEVEDPLQYCSGVLDENGAPLEECSLSPLFDVQLPEDNVFGVGPDVIPELLLSPSAESGYYLFLNPLTPGEHTIEWTASCDGIAQEGLYNITVRRGRGR